MKNIEAATS